MELFFNYIFAILFPFGQDGWQVLSLISIIFVFKYFNVWKRDKIILSLVFFLFYGLILSLFSNNISTCFGEMQNYFIGWLFPFLLGYAVIDEKHKIKMLKIYLYLFSAIILISFFAYFNIVPEKIGYITFVRDSRLAVLCSHTMFGGKCGFIFAMLLILFIFKKNIDYINLILSVIFFIAILLSGTRSSYISIFVSFILMMGYYIYSKHSFIKVFTTVFICFALFLFVYNTNSYLHDRINNTNPVKEESLTQRIEMYKFGIQLISNAGSTNIFGFGPSNSAKQAGNINNLPHFHNIYLQIFLDFGIIGFLLFIFVFYNIFKRLLILYKQTTSKLFLMLIFAWITILTSELFDCTLRHQFCAGQCFWITGLVLGGTNDENS